MDNNGTHQKYYQIRKGAVGDAMEEWYREQSPEVKDWVDDLSLQLKVGVEAEARAIGRWSKVGLGERGSRELLGALIAHCHGYELKGK